MRQARCPYCPAWLEVGRNGPQTCANCGRSFDVWLPQVPAPQVRPPAAPPAEAAADGARCATHGNNPAAGVCQRCGDFMCALCSTPIEGHAYCPRCFELLHQRGSLEFTRQAFTLPRVALSLALVSLLGIVCQGLGLVLGPAAIGVGATALRQIGRQPDLPGRGKAVAAIIIGSISSLLTLGYLIYAFTALGFE